VKTVASVLGEVYGTSEIKTQRTVYYVPIKSKELRRKRPINEMKWLDQVSVEKDSSSLGKTWWSYILGGAIYWVEHDVTPQTKEITKSSQLTCNCIDATHSSSS
jgi:hypothetical protein